MCVKMNKLVLVIFTVTVKVSGYFTCHDDPGFDPGEGLVTELQFTWLGTLQYIHVKNGTPHYFRVPRVVLISQQFVLTTAIDAAQIPTDYALGNVVFGDYERDTNECAIGAEELSDGAMCDPAVMMMPIADVLLHPEYKNFGAKNSVALLKLLKLIASDYVLPVCLPFKNYIMRNGKPVKGTFFHIDFSTPTPRDFFDEDKEVAKIALLPMELCYLYESPEGTNRTSPLKDRVMCTTGCGFHSGAPSLVHEHTGHWTLVAIAEGFTSPRARKTMTNPWDVVGHNWAGHWWMGGIRCFDRGEMAEDLYKFYHENFQIKPVERTSFSYHLELHAHSSSTIICVKVGMPYRLVKPKVTGLDTPTAKVDIPIMRLRHMYQLQVQAYAFNSTDGSSSSESSEE